MMGPQNQTSIFSLPTRVGQDPMVEPSLNGVIQPSFLWGNGGARLTPEDLEAKRAEVARERSAGLDFSPVQSWTQGLARVANAWLAHDGQKDIEKQSALVQADRAKSVADLLAAPQAGASGGAGPDPVAMALASNDPTLQKLGMAQFERLHPKPVNNDTQADYNFRVQTLGKDAADEWLRRGNDPFISVTTPAGLYAGPQSGLGPALAGVGATGAPQPVQQPQANIPMGNPLDPNLGRQGPVSKTIGGKTYYQIGGDWYDNSEGR